MQVLFLGAVSPVADSGFLYAPEAGFQGEGAALLNALDLAEQGQENHSVLSDFQRRGYFLTHVLECPMNSSDGSGQPLRTTLQNRLPAVTSRILRSLKPKRIALISADLQDSLAVLRLAGLGDILLLDGERPFDLNSDAGRALVTRLRSSL